MPGTSADAESIDRLSGKTAPNTVALFQGAGHCPSRFERNGTGAKTLKLIKVAEANLDKWAFQKEAVADPFVPHRPSTTARRLLQFLSLHLPATQGPLFQVDALGRSASQSQASSDIHNNACQVPTPSAPVRGTRT